jgi:hypothetical protein
MMLYGGFTLVGALLALRDPKALAALAAGGRGSPTVPDEVTRKLETIEESVLVRHGGKVKANIYLSLAMGLFTLYAVAAILSRDRHGRQLALWSAGVGGAYQLAGVALTLHMALEAVAASTPVLAPYLTRGAEDVSGPRLEELASQIRWAFVARPILAAAIGLGWCALIVVYFGGRRGRALYGVDLPPPA